MKIGFDAKRIFHNSTGLGNYSRDLVRILSEFYPENSYLLYNPKPKKVTRLRLTNNMKEVLPEGKFWQAFSSFWRQGPVTDQVLKDEVNLFHGLTGEIPRGLGKVNCKTVVTIHDLIFVRYPELYSFFDRKIHFSKFKYACENADKVVAISEQTKRDIVEFLKINPEKIEVIYQGCHAVFKETQTVDYIKSVVDKYQIPENFILNVGTVEARKNVLTLIKSIKDLDIPLVVVGGKTSYYKEITTYIAANKLQDRIFFLEGLSLQELSALYQQAKLFVYPSIFEGFGIPIIEALYSKTPVITSTGSCFSEAGGENSLYVNPENVADLTDAIESVLSSEELQEKMIEEGYKFVQKFNDKDIAANYMNLYKSL